MQPLVDDCLTPRAREVNVPMEPRIERLMEKRIDPPKQVAPDVPRPKPWHWHVFIYVRMFILQATLRSVFGAIVKYTMRIPMEWVWTNGYLLVSTLASRAVGPGEYAARERICDECGQQETMGDHAYCRACSGGSGCPKWVLSRLAVKNRKRGHNCPLGLHSGAIAIRKGKANGNDILSRGRQQLG